MNAAWVVLLTLASLGLIKAVQRAIWGCLGDMAQEEVRTRLERLPGTIIGLAARRLPEPARASWAEEWAGELSAILRGSDGLPVTRLTKGTWFALGLLRKADSIGRTVAPGARPRPWTATALGLAQFRDAQAEDLVAGFGAGTLEARTLAEHALAVTAAEPTAAGARRRPDRLAPLRAAAVEELSARLVAELALIYREAGLVREMWLLLRAWLQPERIRGRQAEDVAVIKRYVLAHQPDLWPQFRLFVIRNTEHWSLDQKQEVERMLRQHPEPPGTPEN